MKNFRTIQKNRKFPMTFLKPSSPSHIPNSSLEVKLWLVQCVSSQTCFQTYICVCVCVCVCVCDSRGEYGRRNDTKPNLGSLPHLLTLACGEEKCRVYCRCQARSPGGQCSEAPRLPVGFQGDVLICLLAVMGLHLWEGFPLVAMSGGCSLFWLTGSRAQAR